MKLVPQLRFNWLIFLGCLLLLPGARLLAAEAMDTESGEAESSPGAERDSAVRPGELAPLGAELPDTVRALYIPPTRSGSPLAAAASSVYQLDAKSGEWRSLYHAPSASHTISGIYGYPKNSKAIWVAHSGGIAWSRDGGLAWGEVVPPGWREGQPLRKLAVNPANRHQAVAIQSQRGWWTESQGASWEELPLPAESEPIQDLAWAGGSPPTLVAMTTQGVYCTSNPKESWHTLARNHEGPTMLAAAETAEAYVLFGKQRLVVFDLARPGFKLERTLPPSEVDLLLADPKGRGVLFGVCAQAESSQLVTTSLQDANPDWTRLPLPGRPQALAVHPRQSNTLLVAIGTKVFRIASAPAHEPTLAMLPRDQFASSVGNFEPSASTTTSEASKSLDKAQDALDTVLLEEPSLDEAVEAALLQSGNKPGDVKRWRRLVLTRNLLPQLRVRTGSREVPMSQNSQITEVDRFGIASSKYLREDDQLEGAGYHHVELEWNLSRLLFDGDEVRISEEARKRLQDRNSLVKTISELYYQRLELLVEEHLNGPPESATDAARWKLRKLRLTETLNELCGKPLFQ